MSIGRLVNLVGLCLLLPSTVIAADVPSVRGDLAAMPTAIPSGIGSSWEVSVQPTIGSESEQYPQLIGMNLTKRDTFEILPVEICYKPTYNKTFVLTLPYILRSEELRLGSDALNATDSGLGDITMRLERLFRRDSMAGWDGTYGFNVSIPTGKNIYDDLSDNELPMGTGHYGTGVHLDYRRISDPVVANFGAGIQYIWPRTHNGEQIRPGVGFTIRTGIGYALNDRWVLTEQLEFTRQPNVFLQGALTAATETVDQAYITHGFSYNRSRDSASYSLRFSVGLNSQSTDFIVALGANH